MTYERRPYVRVHLVSMSATTDILKWRGARKKVYSNLVEIIFIPWIPGGEERRHPCSDSLLINRQRNKRVSFSFFQRTRRQKYQTDSRSRAEDWQYFFFIDWLSIHQTEWARVKKPSRQSPAYIRISFHFTQPRLSRRMHSFSVCECFSLFMETAFIRDLDEGAQFSLSAVNISVIEENPRQS